MPDVPDPSSGDEPDEAAAPSTGGGRGRPDDPVLPDVTRDERGVGWNDEPAERDADWYRRERPPHHE